MKKERLLFFFSDVVDHWYGVCARRGRPAQGGGQFGSGTAQMERGGGREGGSDTGINDDTLDTSRLGYH